MPPDSPARCPGPAALEPEPRKGQANPAGNTPAPPRPPAPYWWRGARPVPRSWRAFGRRPGRQLSTETGKAAVAYRAEWVGEYQGAHPVGCPRGQLHGQVAAPAVAEHSGGGHVMLVEDGHRVGHVLLDGGGRARGQRRG